MLLTCIPRTGIGGRNIGAAVVATATDYVVLLILVSLVVVVAPNPVFSQQKSLVIGIDGLGFGEQGFSVTETPWMDSLINGSFVSGIYQGAYADNAIAGGILGTPSQQTTVSGPGWSSMLTGVWIDKHNVGGNSFAGRDFDNNPTYLATLKSARPELITASFVNWSPIDTFIIDSIDRDNDPNNNTNFRGTYASDALVAAGAVDVLSGNGDLDADVVFVAFDEVDGAGHSCGSANACYGREIREADALVGDLLTSVVNRSTFDQEDWQIIVTSDHGHRPAGGHGGQSFLERTIPFIVSSKSVNQGSLPSFPATVAQIDVAPTVLDHFGVAIPENYVGFSRATGASALTPDINGDGVVFGDGTGPAASDDVTAFIALWLQPNTIESPNPADLNLDGIANLADWAILNAADAAMGQAAMQHLSNAPEPSGAALIMLGLLVLMRGRAR